MIIVFIRVVFATVSTSLLKFR